MKSNHILQLESLIKRHLSDLIRNEVKKDIGLVTITDIDLTSDYSYCRVYFTVLPSNAKKKAIEGLEALSGFLRTSLVKRITIKRAPELVFRYDMGFENGKRVEELLKEIKEQ